MNIVQTGRRPNGLDDGNDRQPKGKKRKRGEDEVAQNTGTGGKKDEMSEEAQGLKIMPGESLKEFNRRVDATMQVRLKTKTPHISHLKKLRKLEKKEKARKEREGSKEPEDPDAELSDDYDPDIDPTVHTLPTGKGKRRGRSPSPFAELRKKREKIAFGEVADAPPELPKVRELLRAPGAKNVPKASGSLAKREELGGERKRIIEAYRKMMEGKRGEVGV